MEKRVKDFLKYYTDWDELSKAMNIRHVSLLSGLSGIITLLIDLKEHFKDMITNDLLVDYITKTIEILDQQETVYPSYCDGLTGYGFMLLKVKNEGILCPIKNKELLEQIDSLLEQIDEIAEEQIAQDIFDENYDLLHGLMGMGIYFLEREKMHFVDLIVNKLKETLHRENQTVYWKKYEKYTMYTTVIDLGLAHGLAANLHFISKVASKSKDTALNKLIVEIIDFYLENKQELNENIKSYFPNVLLYEKHLKKTNLPTNSRLGWCYGDVGILYCMYMAATQIKDDKRSQLILDMMLNVSQRREEVGGFVLDSGFCHGYSGLSIMYKNIYTITNDNRFLEAALFWIDKMHQVNVINAQMKQEKDNSLVAEYFDIHNVTLLEGMAGVLYCYTKMLDIQLPLTDEILFLKY
jgi:hypothetical protein